MKAKTEAAMQSLQRVRLDAWAHAKISSLSGGERQRTALARAMTRQNNILLLDEPSSQQDDDGAAIIMESIKAAVQQSITVIVVSHDARLTDAPLFSRACAMTGGTLRDRI